MRLHASIRFLSVTAFTGALLGACGGATDTGLFDSTGGVSSDDAGLSHDTGAPSTTPDSGTSHPTHDAGPSPIPDASSGDDAGHVTPPPPAATIDCAVSGTVTTCDAATQVCCRTQNGNGIGVGAATYACTPPSGCAQPGTLAIPCDNADDCTAQGFAAGTVCCVTEDPNSGVAASIACVAQTDCAAQTQTWLCNEGTAASDCPANDTCETSTSTIPGYKICK
jgi:hypothetical protein